MIFNLWYSEGNVMISIWNCARSVGKKTLEDPSLPMDKSNKKSTLPTPLVQVVHLTIPKRDVLSL
jgi:hypothetical protein